MRRATTRQAQAALEFLTTYGWAFLIILVMIGAISYFGILNPSKLLPSRCGIGTEFTCTDYQIDGTGKVSVVVQQGVGQTIFFEWFNCTYEGASVSGIATDSNGNPVTPSESWSPNSAFTFNCAIPSIINMKGKKAKVYLDIGYQTSSTGFLHTDSGELYTEVQS